MDGIQMEPIGKYKADRNGSAKAAWRNMVDQDLDDVAFLADTDKAREARELREAPVAVCSQRRALCLAALVFSAMFATALLVVYATPQADCPCAGENPLVPGSPPAGSDASNAAANKERIASNGAVFPWRGARLPTFVIPKHYNLWLHPNLTTGELRGEVSIDFKVDRDTSYVVLNVRDMNVTERALFKGGGVLGPKVLRSLDYLPADQTYIEFKEKLRRKYNYTLSLRFITKLERNEKQRGFFMTGTHKHRCAVSRFWLTHARSAFPCLDEPHLRATFKLTIVRDRFHVSLTNMPIMATEEAGFYLGHRLLQDEFAQSPPMPPHMMSMAVCRLQRRAAPPLPTEATINETTPNDVTTVETYTTTDMEDENIVLPPPEISLYSDQQVILDESGPLLEWVQKTIQHFSFELNTSYPLPKFDIVVVEGGNQYSEGWGLITLSPAMLSDTKTLARLLAQQWFGGLVSPRWWSSQWLMEALTSVLAEKAPAYGDVTAERQLDALLLDHVLPALRLDSSNSVRAVASPRLERADIEAASDELSLHKGAAIVSMAIEAAGDAAGRAALARLLRAHRAASADARDLWRALERESNTSLSSAWDGWCSLAGYPLLGTAAFGGDVLVRQVRFVMQAPQPRNEPSMAQFAITEDLRTDLNNVFYEPENYTETEEDVNATTTTTPAPTTRRYPKTTPALPEPKWIVPLTFVVGPLKEEDTKIVKNSTEVLHNSTWYDVGNDTKPVRMSRWAQNVTHLIWMNDTEMTIPDLGKHKWVRYNVGARGLYRVAPDDRYTDDTETDEEAIVRAAAMYDSGAPAERALLLDDAFVLARARRLPASRAIAAASRLTTETHWAPWRVGLSHLSWWRQLLALGSSGPGVNDLLAKLHPPNVPLYSDREIDAGGLNEDQLWLSGALLRAGVEWRNAKVTKQATELFDVWLNTNQTIPDIYQEAAFTAGIRSHGELAWRACWRALMTSLAAPRPLYNHKALLNALGSSPDDWLFNKFAVVVMSNEARRSLDWADWATSLCDSACRWRGAASALRVCRGDHLPPSALQAAARCIHLAEDYHTFKNAFGSLPGGPEALDIIALNINWMERADADIARYFTVLDRSKQ
ncbi:endoplasmic reticulum aminopeptidase 2 isoform X2 [Plodia interpunctella]|uniref:endoplasmic reticulum aminopeptidase 2 isoform X2 n=1 Tax=Plodia interpunctella TaxID=58824 RepID=UPI002367A6C1|nr:endoplasmic reticulum aminopeptidase 2 isoform X2 [Plodia interpunctella]